MSTKDASLGVGGDEGTGEDDGGCDNEGCGSV